MESKGHNKMPAERLRIAIIGGGFSGSVAAAQLLLQANSPLSLTVVERRGQPGRGVAYGTPHSCHLLNVPAGNMSAFPDDPNHFVRWARLNDHPEISPETFAPRSVYGEYVASVLENARQSAQGIGSLAWLADEVQGLKRDGDIAIFHLRSGKQLIADKVLLAMGNFPPGDPVLPGRRTTRTGRYMSYAWAPGALDGLKPGSSILLIGSGLTSMDLAVAFKLRGFQGTIHILSRRGLLPQLHAKSAEMPFAWDQLKPLTVRNLFRAVRAQIEANKQRGGDWRSTIDSFRPYTQKIWRALSLAERRRFLRHVRPYWEVLRHRVAPQTGHMIRAMIASGQIQMHGGQILYFRESSDHVQVSIRHRDDGYEQMLCVDRVINCTGPECDYRKLEDPLMRSLLGQGMVRPDPLFLGLDVVDSGAVIDSDGFPSDWLYVLGPLRKGSLWETTAVPEIRIQAKELCHELLKSHDVRQGTVPSEQSKEVVSVGGYS